MANKINSPCSTKQSESHKWMSFITQQRCVVLLIALLALLTLYPYLGGDAEGPSRLMNILTSFVMIGGVYAVSRRRRHFIIAIIIFVPAMSGNWTEGYLNYPALNIILSALKTLFFIFMSILVISYVLHSKSVSIDRLAGAMCGYLLIGVVYASLYGFLYKIQPNAFSFTNFQNAHETIVQSNLIFYSFVTLTTLGYGDILPVTSQAQSLAILESITGVLYVAAFIAWIVSSVNFRATGNPINRDSNCHS